MIFNLTLLGAAFEICWRCEGMGCSSATSHEYLNLKDYNEYFENNLHESLKSEIYEIITWGGVNSQQ